MVFNDETEPPYLGYFSSDIENIFQNVRFHAYNNGLLGGKVSLSTYLSMSENDHEAYLNDILPKLYDRFGNEGITMYQVQVSQKDLLNYYEMQWATEGPSGWPDYAKDPTTKVYEIVFEFDDPIDSQQEFCSRTGWNQYCE